MVSVFWVNYNSMHIINIIRKSLDVLLQLDLPQYELIIVDNGSTDGSIRVIEEHVKGAMNQVNVKLVKLKRNMGFTGGVNAAYRARDRRSKYVAIVNNDAIPRRDYLKKLVEFLEEHKDVGAVQGKILKIGEPSVIDSAASFINEALNVFSPFKNKLVNTFSKPLYVSYVEGTMPVYKVDAIKHVLKDDNIMYITEGFTYYLEDVFLSLMLWSHGYKCMALPIITGEHYRMATVQKFHQSVNVFYYGSRNRVALLYMTNSRYKKGIVLKYLSGVATSKGNLTKRRIILRALIDGIKLGKELKERYGVIDLYKAPLMKMSLKEPLFRLLQSLAHAPPQI